MRTSSSNRSILTGSRYELSNKSEVVSISALIGSFLPNKKINALY